MYKQYELKINIENKAKGRLFWNSNDNIFIIEGIKVNGKYRKQGLGTHLIRTIEETADMLGAYSYMLFVESNSWMYKWYIKLGYQYAIDHTDPKYVWLKKDRYERINK